MNDNIGTEPTARRISSQRIDAGRRIPRGPVPAPLAPRGHSPARPSASAASVRSLMAEALNAGITPDEVAAAIAGRPKLTERCPECGAGMRPAADGIKRCTACGVTQ